MVARFASPAASLLLLVAFGALAPARGSGESLDPLLDKLRERTHVPGIVAAAVRDGEIVAVGTSGVRELGKPEELTLEDRFLIGSCTKAMTRLLIARLIQAGKLAADATLPQLLKGVPMRTEYEAATLANLMEHTAGLQPYTRITPKLTPIVFELRGTPTEQRKAFAEHLLQESPAGAVGKDFIYSNAGYSLLGNLAERAAGKPWEELIAREVFDPLQMADATIGLPQGEGTLPLAIGHRRTEDGFAVARQGPAVTGLFAPAGGVVLTIEDFARFAIAEIAVERGDGGAFLSKETCAKLAKMRPRDASGEGEIFLGGQGTYTAGFAVWPARRFGVVVCTNGGDGDPACESAIGAIRAELAPEIKAAAAPKTDR